MPILTAAQLTTLNGFNLQSRSPLNSHSRRLREIGVLLEDLEKARGNIEQFATDANRVAQIEYSIKMGMDDLDKLIDGDGTWVEGPKSFSQKSLAELSADMSAPIVKLRTPGTDIFLAAQAVASVPNPNA